jgi:hypothetical protein
MIIEILFVLDSLQPFDGLRNHYDSLASAKKIELRNEGKRKWLNYLPTAGVNFAPSVDATGRVRSVLRPAVSWNIGKLYDLAQRKAERKNLLNAELIRIATERRADSIRIVGLLWRLENEALEDSIDLQIERLDREMFIVTEARYKDAIITVDQYIAAQKAVLERAKERAQRAAKRREIEAEIRNSCKC